MSFRKRNIGVSSMTSSNPDTAAITSVSPDTLPQSQSQAALVSGTRPSPLDGRLTTSTGASSFDTLLAGHAGLPLGNSLLIEESGTTDYAGPLIRYYAAEAIAHGHVLHVIGVGAAWIRELPGIVAAGSGEEGHSDAGKGKEERMKIAWRYERLGAAGYTAAMRRAPLAIDRTPASSSAANTPEQAQPFCHTFDLAKRMSIPATAHVHHHAIAASSQTSPFASILQSLTTLLRASPRDTVHRVAIPALLSPALYPPHASEPHHLLPFIHALRALLRLHPHQLTFMASLPLTLYPRTSALIRTVELLCDGVLELTPFPHALDDGLGPGGGASSFATSGASTALEEKPQGLLTVHKLPVLHERGGGGGGGLGGWGDDLAFTLSRRKFTIRPFSLPPAEGDTEAQKGEAEGGKLTKESIEF